MSGLRKRLTYSNVLSTVAVFLALGGTAFAAAQLAKNSVGTPQLKKNAVTTAKLKKNAVATAKVRKGAINTARLKGNAVTTAKIKKNAVTGAKIKASTTPFSRVTARLRNAGPVAFVGEGVTPISVGTYSQPPGESDLYLGGLDVTFEPSCTAPRSATAFLLIDPPDPNKPSSFYIAAFGVVSDEAGATSTHRMNLSPYPGETLRGMRSFEPSATEDHSFYVYLVGLECTTGSGATASNFGIDVIGAK